jgi:hypothetical protein
MDFNWLNEVSDTVWQPSGNGQWYIEMDHDEFRRRSKMESGQQWQSAFTSWGIRQPRHYSYLNRDSMLWVLADIRRL